MSTLVKRKTPKTCCLRDSKPESAKRIRHDMEPLDEIIQKDFKTMGMIDAFAPVTIIFSDPISVNSGIAIKFL
ncbi:MAG: hypothetical protein K0Q73_7400 [Paenibacillus sp.]|nr:hypothetical protein [Paenibacillus sp.]